MNRRLHFAAAPILLTLAALLLILGSLGCGEHLRVVGHWSLDPAKSQVVGIDKTSTQAQKYLNGISLDFNQDGTFALVFLAPIKGQYSVSGSSVTLSAKGLSDSGDDSRLVGKINGSELILPMQRSTLVFHRDG